MFDRFWQMDYRQLVRQAASDHPNQLVPDTAKNTLQARIGLDIQLLTLEVRQIAQVGRSAVQASAESASALKRAAEAAATTANAESAAAAAAQDAAVSLRAATAISTRLLEAQLDAVEEMREATGIQQKIAKGSQMMAGATVVLAICTFWLACETRRMASPDVVPDSNSAGEAMQETVHPPLIAPMTEREPPHSSK
jgi:hypothetical protein